MIGMVGKDRRCPEQLLGEHCADEQVRPGRGPERQQQVRLGSLRLLVAIGGADREARLALAAVAPFLEPACKLRRRERLSALVEEDGDAIRRKRRRRSPGVRQFGQLRRPGDALQIALDQLGFRRSADLSSSDDVKEQLTVRRWPSGRCRASRRLPGNRRRWSLRPRRSRWGGWCRRARRSPRRSGDRWAR